MKKMIAAAICVFTMLAFSGCKGGTLTSDFKDDKTVVVTADEAGKGSGVNGYVTVSNNEKLLISSELDERGQITVRVLSNGGAGDVVIEDVFSGTVNEEYELPEGEYMLGFTVDKRVSGTMKAVSK